MVIRQFTGLLLFIFFALYLVPSYKINTVITFCSQTLTGLLTLSASLCA